MQAIYERAYRLGLVAPGDRPDFYRKLNARDWRVREPVSDELAVEQPELTQRIGAKMRERGLSDIEIAHMAGFASVTSDNPFCVQRQRLHAV